MRRTVAVVIVVIAAMAIGRVVTDHLPTRRRWRSRSSGTRRSARPSTCATAMSVLPVCGSPPALRGPTRRSPPVYSSSSTWRTGPGANRGGSSVLRCGTVEDAGLSRRRVGRRVRRTWEVPPGSGCMRWPASTFREPRWTARRSVLAGRVRREWLRTTPRQLGRDRSRAQRCQGRTTVGPELDLPGPERRLDASTRHDADQSDGAGQCLR